MSLSSTSQAPLSTIQFLQSRTVSILEPVNSEKDDAILGTATDTRATTALNVTTCFSLRLFYLLFMCAYMCLYVLNCLFGYLYWD